jgi:transcriptional regulator with XRE-family HTH domain
MSINQRIIDFMEIKNFNSSQFAKIIGVSQPSISKLIKSEHLPSSKTLIPLKENFPELDMNWIIVGSGQMIIKDSIQIETKENLNKTIGLLTQTNDLQGEKIERLEKENKELLAQIQKLTRS